MSSMTEYKGKPVKKVHKTNDYYGNPVQKIFYEDGTTEIVRHNYAISHYCDKYYKSLSGLYQSK